MSTEQSKVPVPGAASTVDQHRTHSPSGLWVACIIGVVGLSLFTVLLWTGKTGPTEYIVLLSLLVIVCLYFAGPNEWIAYRRQVPEGPKNTSRAIAFFLLVFFGAALGFTGGVAAYRPEGDSKDWLDLFKSGFLLLGGGLTTVIGYYFGSRETARAAEAATEAAASARDGPPGPDDLIERRPHPRGPLQSPAKQPVQMQPKGGKQR
jgi:hypothetical protein